MSRPVIFAVLVLGLFATSVPCYADSPLYEATATIWVRSVKPSLLSEDRQLSEGEYNRFLNTQIELLKHPVVIDKALESPDVAPLPIVREQKDKRAWLIGRLGVHNDKSELVYVSITMHSAEASEKIVNAVIDAYFQFIEESAMQTNRALLNNLRIEERRQRTFVQGLQARIREITLEAAKQGVAMTNDGMNIGLVQGESLVRDVALAEAKLTSLQSSRKGIIEQMEQLQNMPISIIKEFHITLDALKETRDKLAQLKDSRKQVVSNPAGDLRIMQFDRQIELIDEKIKAVTTASVDDSTQEAAQNQVRIQEEVKLFQLDQEIRAQQILVEELTKKYNEQLMKSVERAQNVLDVSSEQAALEWTHRTLDRIDERLNAIIAEQRAPGQITLVSRAVVSSQSSQTTPTSERVPGGTHDE